MAARFTENQGDPAWLKSQRAAQARVIPTPRQQRAMPYPTQTPAVTPVQSDVHEFRKAATTAGNVAFVLGFLGVRRALKGRR